MKRVACCLVLLALVCAGACGEKAAAPPAATPSAAGAADLVRLWLEAAKRGDGEAMVALRVPQQRQGTIVDARTFAAQVASGGLHAATWQVGAEAGEGDERRVSAHVVWREIPEGGDNLEFGFVRREGRWWLVGIVHCD